MRVRWTGWAVVLLALAGCKRSADAPEAPAGRATPAPVPADPVAQALQAATETDAERAFYARAGWKPVWVGETAGQLARAVAARRDHGLDRVDFAAGAPAGGNGEAGGEAADVARTRAALRFAAALARGAVEPKSVHTIYTLARPNPDLAAELSAALKERRVDAWLDGLAPQDETYRALSAAYRDAADGVAPPAPPPPEPVMRCTEPAPVPRATAPAPAPVPDPAATATAIPDDAERAAPPPPTPVAIPDDPERAAPPEPVCELVSPPAPPRPKGDPRPALAVAMERLRWLERTAPATRIDVNIATARLTYWRDGAIADARPVVVGANDTRTPQLSSPIFRLVANPTWTIPASIVRKDKMTRRSAQSLARSGMAWKNGRIVQKPGPRNALGLVKFDMRNGYAIYLHDTPSKGLFAAAERHRSHGCVRVKDALGFAALLAGDQGVGDAWARASARGRTAYIPLPREIPVRLLYATVLPDAAGVPVVRADPYGWDAAVARRLGFAAVARPVAPDAPADLGP